MLPASAETMLFAVETPVVILLAWPLLGEVPSRATVLLCLISFTGGGFLSWHTEADSHALPRISVAFVLGGVFSRPFTLLRCGGYRNQGCALRLATATQIVALVVVVPAWIAFGRSSGPFPTIEGAATVTASGLLLMAIPLFLYGIALERMSATEAPLILFLVPVFTAVLASIFLGETMSAR